MTPKERAKESTRSAGMPQWGSKDQEELETEVEQAIIAAIEEERKTRQHQFVGRTDRGCELCGEPDRDEIHIFSRETYRNWLNLAVAEEREACAKIANGIEARYAIGSSNYAEGATTAARIIGDDIRARGCNNSATETYSKEEKIR